MHCFINNRLTRLQLQLYSALLPLGSAHTNAAVCVGDLDALIAAHEAYVDGMQRRLLLAPPADPLVRLRDLQNMRTNCARRRTRSTGHKEKAEKMHAEAARGWTQGRMLHS